MRREVPGSLHRFAPAWLAGAAILVATVPTLAIAPVSGRLTGVWYATLNSGAGILLGKGA